MIRRFGSRLVAAYDRLICLQMDLGVLDQDKETWTVEARTDATDAISALERVAADLKMTRSTVSIQRLKRDLQTVTVADFLARLQHVDEDLRYDLNGVWFLPLAREGAESYRALFGGRSDVAFPSAGDDIQEAHACFALGVYTAGVFHLMRAVEYPMRQVAIAVGVGSPKVPLEYQQWQHVIDQIVKGYEATNVGVWPEPARGLARAFFSRTISDLHAFKDETRNVLMHGRSGLYEEQRARSVKTRVGEFFERVSMYVAEGGTVGQLQDPTAFRS